MTEQIDFDDPELTHMLGYLTTEKWADAVRQNIVSKETAFKFIDIQDGKYGGHLRQELEELLAMSNKDWSDHMFSLNKRKNNY
jgi:hypothetical protein